MGKRDDFLKYRRLGVRIIKVYFSEDKRKFIDWRKEDMPHHRQNLNHKLGKKL